MKNNINLFTQKKHYDRKLRQRITILRNISIGLLFIVAASSMVLFLLIASSPLPQFKKQESDALLQISQLHTKMGKHLLVQDQLKSITIATNTRKNYNDLLALIRKGLVQNIKITNVQIEKDEMKLTFSTTTLSDFDLLIRHVDDLTSGKKIFDRVMVDSLDLVSETGEYALTLIISEKKR